MREQLGALAGTSDKEKASLSTGLERDTLGDHSLGKSAYEWPTEESDVKRQRETQSTIVVNFGFAYCGNELPLEFPLRE